jgi:hypothetical protein
MDDARAGRTNVMCNAIGAGLVESFGDGNCSDPTRREQCPGVVEMRDITRRTKCRISKGNLASAAGGRVTKIAGRESNLPSRNEKAVGSIPTGEGSSIGIPSVPPTER